MHFWRGLLVIAFLAPACSSELRGYREPYSGPDAASGPDLDSPDAARQPDAAPTEMLLTDLNTDSALSYELDMDGLTAGTLVYIDRDYTCATVPAVVEGAAMVRTANDDKQSLGTSFVRFTSNVPVDVYVAHDRRIDDKPAWLAEFTAVGEAVVTAEGDDEQALDLFVESFDAGEIELGGNGGGESNNSMYSVAIVPR